jgi:uncharacterized membrane protein YfcA
MTTFLVLTILFLATLIRSSVGFGDALVAMPLLTLIIGLELASPVVAFMGLTIGVLIALRSWQNIDVGSVWRLVLASAVGVPLGIFLLTSVPESLVKRILGTLLILFSLYSLIRPNLPQLGNQHWAYGFGFISGILGGAYNTSGPPVVIYGALRHWSPARFRATLQGYFVPSLIIVAVGHGLAGLWTDQVFRLYFLALLPMLVAIWLGGKLNKRLPVEQFARALYILLIILGILLLV